MRRIMVDANVLVSAALFPNSATARSLTVAVKEHQLLICDYVLEEVHSVFERKFPDKIESLDTFISKLAYERCDTPSADDNTPDMRDDDDKPILQAAINANADIILTGDKDFHALNVEQPKIMSPNAILGLKSVSI